MPFACKGPYQDEGQAGGCGERRPKKEASAAAAGLPRVKPPVRNQNGHGARVSAFVSRNKGGLGAAS